MGIHQSQKENGRGIVLNGRLNGFLLLVVAASIGGLVSVDSLEQVWGEKGKNYDTSQINEITTQWVSHPDRVFNGVEWVNYVWSETPQYIRFESGTISFEFYKNTCDFKLYPQGLIGSNRPLVDSISHSLQVNTVDILLPVCSWQNISTNARGITFEAVRNPLVTFYELDFAKGLEYTHQITSNQVGLNDFTIVDVCTNCLPVADFDDIVVFDNGLQMDTKNTVHGTERDREFRSCPGPIACPHTARGDYVVNFEATLNNGKTIIIDPVFTQTGSTYFARVDDGDNSDTCDVGTSKTDQTGTTNFVIRSFNIAGANDCTRGVIEWDISSIPDASTILDVDINYDIDAATNGRNCDIYQISSQPSVTGFAALFTDIKDGNAYVTNDATCATAGNNKSNDLGSDGNDDLRDQLSSDWFAVGFSFNDETVDGTQDTLTLDDSGGATPAAELVVVYTSSPDINAQLSTTVGNIGDTARVSGTVTIADGLISTNVTQILFIVNGTTENTNATINNSTQSPHTVNYGPFWHRMTTDNTFNFTIQVTAENVTASATNTSSTLLKREYNPDYTTATTPTLGTYNYTVERIDSFDSVNLKVNRKSAPSGDTWPLNCIFQNGAQALQNVHNHTSTSLDGTWHNTTSNVGYVNLTATGLAGTNVYGTCLNPHDEVFHFTSYTNGSLVALGIEGFDNLFGGFIGVPIGILFVALFAYMATPKTAPTYIIFVVAMLALIGAAGFFTLTTNTWGLIIIGAAVGLLVKKLL